METPITLVELPPWQHGILNGQPSYDEFSLVMSRLPPRALPTLEAVARDRGYRNVQSISPICNPSSRLTQSDWQRLLSSEVVGLSAITRTSKQTLELARILKLNSPRTKIVVGGPHFTVRYEDALDAGIDAVVLREGEKTFPDLLDSKFNPDKMAEVKGIAFRDSGKTVVTSPQPFLTPDELSQIHPFYNGSLTPRTIPVIETMRGCPHNCDQCQVSDLYGGKFRVKSSGWAVDELGRIDQIGQTLFYTADSISSNKERLHALSSEVSVRGLNRKFGVCQITAKDLKDPRVIDSLKKLGIKMACIGIESMNPEFLQEMGKPCTTDDNHEAAQALYEAKIWRHGMFMTGESDTRESLEHTLQWAIENLDSAQFFPMGNIPGTKFDRRVREEGRVVCEDPSKCDGHHVLVRPKYLSPYELQVITDGMYSQFYSPRNNLRRIARAPDKSLAITLAFYTNLLGGLTKVSRSQEHREHLEFLRSIS